MKRHPYTPGAWRGEDGMQPLDADAWVDVMTKSHTEREREEKERKKVPTPSDKDA